MQIDNNIKNELLSLNDDALKNMINTIALSAGMNPAKFKISDNDINKIRSAISSATNEDANKAINTLGGADKAAELLEQIKKSTKG